MMREKRRSKKKENELTVLIKTMDGKSRELIKRGARRYSEEKCDKFSSSWEKSQNKEKPEKLENVFRIDELSVVE